MSVLFRNVDASITDPVDSWPYEGLVAVLERGLVPDWRPVLAEIRSNPWGRTARRIQRYASYAQSEPVADLFVFAIRKARTEWEEAEREEVADRVRRAVSVSGLTAAEFAESIGTSASRLSTYASGKVTPSAAMLLRIERRARRDSNPQPTGSAS